MDGPNPCSSLWRRVSGQKFALDFNPQATISVSAGLRLEGLVLFNVTANRKSRGQPGTLRRQISEFYQ